MENAGITFKVRYGGDEYHIETYRAEYKNLMELIKDKIYPDGFGECGGMGRCGTCLAFLAGEPKLLARLGNEATTLSKTKFNNPNLRLCCKVLVDNSLQNMTISILEHY
jgi:2Fe-2S ferredoxin